MGRTSKRKSSIKEKKQKTTIQKIYKAALYARLSSDLDEKKNESIDIQLEIGRKFVDDFNATHINEKIEIVDCYKDLGKTGANFKRDEFQRLMQDIRLGDIDCIIVKDLSRFGRNYLEAGNYIEKIFPFLGVRFIAVSDGYDTGRDGNEMKQMATEIKNLVNDMYVKDFSKKARIQLRQRREEGSYVGGPPPYGYTAGWKDEKRVLIPDDKTANIVRFIFERFLETESYAAVIDVLNEKRIYSPSDYKKTGEVYAGTEVPYRGWNGECLRRILKSRTYIGTLEQGKTTITAHDESNRVRKAKEEWVVRENVHIAIIDMKSFYEAKRVIKKIQEKKEQYKHPTQGYPMEENIFDTVLYCGVCGKKMTRNSYVQEYADGRKERKYGYFCSNADRKKKDICPQNNRIPKKDLLDTMIPLIQKEFACYLDNPSKYQRIGREKLHETELEINKKIRHIENTMFQLKEDETESYMKYQSGNIIQKEFVEYKLKNKEIFVELGKRKQELEEKQKRLNDVSERYLRAICALIKFKTGKNLTKELLESLIEKIYVYPGRRIEIFFQYTNEMLEGVV